MKGAPEAQGMTKALSWMFIDHNARRVPKPRIAEENRWREKEWKRKNGKLFEINYSYYEFYLLVCRGTRAFH